MLYKPPFQWIMDEVFLAAENFTDTKCEIDRSNTDRTTLLIELFHFYTKSQINLKISIEMIKSNRNILLFPGST